MQKPKWDHTSCQFWRNWLKCSKTLHLIAEKSRRWSCEASRCVRDKSTRWWHVEASINHRLLAFCLYCAQAHLLKYSAYLNFVLTIVTVNTGFATFLELGWEETEARRRSTNRRESIPQGRLRSAEKSQECLSKVLLFLILLETTHTLWCTGSSNTHLLPFQPAIWTYLDHNPLPEARKEMCTVIPNMARKRKWLGGFHKSQRHLSNGIRNM